MRKSHFRQPRCQDIVWTGSFAPQPCGLVLPFRMILFSGILQLRVYLTRDGLKARFLTGRVILEINLEIKQQILYHTQFY